MGEIHTVDVYVDNRGLAAKKIADDASSYVMILPHITSVTPASGSVQGGTRITVKGGGFSSNSRVFLKDEFCHAISVCNDEIVCITTNSLKGDSEV